MIVVDLEDVQHDSIQVIRTIINSHRLTNTIYTKNIIDF